MQIEGMPMPFICPTSSQNLKNVETVKESKKKLKTKIKRQKKDPLSAPPLEFGTKLEPGCVIMTLPIRTVSEGNNFDHWQKKHERHKAQQRAVMFAMIPIKQHFRLPCRVTCIRYGPRELDRHDNLPYSLKWINDQIAIELTGELRKGKADNDPRITFSFDQIKSKVYAVKIILEF